MIVRLAWRSLATRPIRTAVLACGFGFGVAIMASLLGVGDVILEQAHSPALQGGGDLVIAGTLGRVENARFLMQSVLGAPDFTKRTAAVSPSKSARLYLMSPRGPIPIDGTGGIPSREKAVGDPEVAGVAEWTDAPADAAWAAPDPADILRAMDRFHRPPDVPRFASSWAEWLYFNGRSHDGRVRFYLTFLVGPTSTRGRRAAGVRLQLERDGRSTSYSASGDVDEATVIDRAPDLDIAGSRVRLDGLRYRIALALPGAAGDLVVEGAPGRSLPPAVIRGAQGWMSGYVVPVLSGTVKGALTIGSDIVAVDGPGYHDHNWGFWQGVRWQWGQVAHDDLSIVYGRLFPPADVADPDRVPGFLGVLGPDGPIGFSTTVSIEETADARARDQPARLLVRAGGASLDLRLEFDVEQVERTAMAMTAPSLGGALDFLQMGGTYRVTGHAGDRSIAFTARGAAETFRKR